MFVTTSFIVIALVLGGILLAWRGYSGRRDDARDEFGGRAVAAAGAAERFFNERLDLLDALADSPSVRSGDGETMSAELTRFATGNLGFDRLTFIDDSGRLRASGDPDVEPGLDLSDRAYVQEILEGEPRFVSEGVVGRLTGEPTVVLSVPVEDDSGSVVGVLAGGVFLDGVTDIIPTDSGDHLQIVDSAGNLVYDGGTLAELGPPADSAVLALREGEARAVPDLGGRPDRVAAHATVSPAGWDVVLSRAEASMSGTARDAFYRELLLLGVIGAMALALLWWNARRIDRLHRSDMGHADEIAALEKFTAALAAAETPAAVGQAVSEHAPAVLGTERVELIHASGDVPGDALVIAPGEEPVDAHRQSLIATMNEQTALALERARSGAEVEHLATLGSALARATTTDEVIAAILEHGAVVDDVYAVRASVHDVERNTLRIVDRDPARRRPDTVAEIPIQAAHPQAEAVRTGDLVTVADADELHARFPDWAQAAESAGVVAAVAAPFVLGREPVRGVMALAFDRPRRLDSRERALISTVSRLGADALTRAQRFEQEQRVADTLQASLQPEQFPLVDGWRFTGVTLPGEAGLSVGGDWYDVTLLPHGAILLSVGDVTGRGPVAAGVMGTVRAAVRALALSDPDPASILEHTDDLLRGSTVNQLATAWVGLLEPATGELRFASAGHVPPLVLGPRGRRFLDDVPGLLLGTGLPGSRRSSRHEIEPDASIVAYTDGLCERRGESLEVGLKRMAVALGDGIGLDAAKVVRRLVGRPTADDIAIVVATRLLATASSTRSEQSVAAAG
jgi:Stage II sporulation protein E (SpoIIE)/Cache domain/GAF domain